MKDLFDEIAADAGKGMARWAPQQSIPDRLKCRTCGNPLVDGQMVGDRCLSCAWAGAGERANPWSATPADATVLGSYVPRTPPMAHQLTALRRSRGARMFAQLGEMGTGKTKELIDEWAMMVELGEVRDLVVVAPKGVYRNWEGPRETGSTGEMGIHLPERILERCIIVTWRSGGGVHWRRRLELMLANTDPQRPRVLLVNIEALSSVRQAEEAMLLVLAARRATVIIDESTRIRTFDANRTEVMLKAGPLAQYRRIASGLITPRSPLDLYSQFEFLDWRILGFRTYHGFKARYAVTRKLVQQVPRRDGTGTFERKANIVVGYRHIGELRDKIADHSFRVLKDECLDLPPKVYKMRHVDLTDEQRRIYDSLKRTAQAALPTGDYISAPDILPRLIRMQQVLCGYAVSEDGVERDVPSYRLEELMSVLEDHDGKALIWSPHVRTLNEIVGALQRTYGKQSVVRFWGEVGDAEREEAKVRFQEDHNTRFFVGNPMAGGLGITLTAASLVVYYSNSPDLEHRMQSEDRAHRKGLRHVVTYVDLCALGTIDERWISALRRKMDVAAAINGESPRAWLV